VNKIAIVYHSETGNTEKQAELVAEGAKAAGAEAKLMSVKSPDVGFLRAADAVILGCPTYEGSCSWQMKRFLDECPADLGGKLGGVFCSQNWPGGGGADFSEMTLIAGMLVHGMLIYSGGIRAGHPPVHFGAVSRRSPEGLDAERARKLGENIARKALDLSGGGK